MPDKCGWLLQTPQGLRPCTIDFEHTHHAGGEPPKGAPPPSEERFKAIEGSIATLAREFTNALAGERKRIDRLEEEMRKQVRTSPVKPNGVVPTGG
jgi:hypothetical protein